LIVALNQEKAYDKISHDYLWEVLKRFGLPSHFIKTVAVLYHNAESVVIINGVISPLFNIYRGVRQGDPLSCLLFDYAIEPLTLMLKSSSLKGYKIPHLPKRLIASLFADDITVYLREEDHFPDLLTLLYTWCKAAGAKFNMEKTGIVPIGKREFRENFRLI
jgi:hypothetical protein